MNTWQRSSIFSNCMAWGSFWYLCLQCRGLLLLSLPFRRNLRCHRAKFICDLSKARALCWLGWPATLHQQSPFRITRIWNRRSQSVAHNTPWNVQKKNNTSSSMKKKTARKLDMDSKYLKVLGSWNF